MLKVIIFLTLCGFAFGDENCKCKDSSFTSSWGAFTPTSICNGKCNGIQKGVRECHASKNGDIFSTSMCNVERVCQNPDTCEGNWSPWSNIGSCLNSCSQMQSRYCYQNISSVLIRNRFCLGGNGSSEQNRFSYCKGGACNSANSDKEKTESSTSGNRHRSSSDPGYSAVTDGDSNPVQTTNTNLFQENDITTVQTVTKISDGKATNNSKIEASNNGLNSNSILLIAVLGSVGLLSLAAFSFGVAYVVTKRRGKTNESILRRRRGAEPNRYVTKGFESTDIYATVGPALPDRPPCREAPSPNENGRVYETTEKTIDSFESSLEAQDYLLPGRMPNDSGNSQSDDTESIYWNINEKQKEQI